LALLDLLDRDDIPEDARQAIREEIEAAHQSDERYRLLATNATDMIIRLALDGTIIDASPSSFNLSGYPPAELIGRHAREFVHPDDMEVLYRVEAAILDRPAAQTMEWRLVRKDGRSVWVETTTQAVRDSEGTVTEFVAVGRDVSDRKKAEDELAKRLDLESQVSHMLGRLIRLPLSELDAGISEALGLLSTSVGAHRAGVFVIDHEAGTASRTHEWSASPGDAWGHETESVDTGWFRYSVSLMERGDILRISRPTDLPAAAVAERAMWESHEFRAGLFFPLGAGEGLYGALGFYGPPGQVLEWPDHFISLVAVVADALFALLRRREAEEALIEREARLQSVFRSAPVGIGLTVNRVLLEANDRLCEMTGYPREELLGQSARMLYLTDEDYESVGREKYAQIRDRGTGTVETHWKRKDGALIDVLLSSTPLHGRDWSGGGTFTALDITARKRAESELRRARELLQAAIDQSSAGIIIADAPDVRVRMVNAAALSIHGQPPGPSMEALEKEMASRWRVLYPDGRPMAFDDMPLARAIARGEVIRNELVVARDRSGNDRWVSANASPIRDADGTIRAGILVLNDITDVRRAEEDRRQLEAQIQHTQKLESLGVLAGGIAHDFNNLLVGVLGNASMALAQLGPDSPARTCLEQIETAALRAADLAKQMLAYSGRGRFVVESVDLARLVDGMSHLLESSISKKAVLRRDLKPGMAVVEGDATQLRQIVMNLVTNASEAFGDEPGVITVAASVIDADRDYLLSTYVDDDLPPGRYVSLEVSDTGHGMDEDTRSRVFDPFFSTKRVGRGLGMAAVLGIVRGHGGAIKVYSEPGRGTSIRVLLPCAEAATREVSSGAPGAAEPDQVALSETILVADDEEAVRQVTRLALEMAGFSVITAADGEEAVERFAACPLDIRAVLLDLSMPKMSGDEAFEAIKRIRPDVPIVLSSGFNEQDTTSRIAGRGLAGFIQKPYRPTELIDRLRQLLGGA